MTPPIVAAAPHHTETIADTIRDWVNTNTRRHTTAPLRFAVTTVDGPAEARHILHQADHLRRCTFAAAYQIGVDTVIVDEAGAWHLARWADTTDTPIERLAWFGNAAHLIDLTTFEDRDGRVWPWNQQTAVARFVTPTADRSWENTPADRIVFHLPEVA